MLKLPTAIITLMQPFQPLFRRPTWPKAQLLLIGSILTTGQRTVTAALRVMGLSDESGFAKYHQVLNRAVWSPYQASGILLRLLLRSLDQELKPLVFGLDDTIERRWGAPNPGPRHLSGSSSFQSEPLCQNQWVTLAQFDVADRNTVGQPGLGLALPDSVGSVGTVLRDITASPQKTAGLGQTDDLSVTALATQSVADCGW